MTEQDKVIFCDGEKKKIKNRLDGYSAKLSGYAAKDSDAVYEFGKERFDHRSNYGQDTDDILNNKFYSRFGDKTQVHSFYKNDDVTRRFLHVQFVSKIARSVGIILNLNLELIEAIALGHDMGHTPFGHRGEVFLDALYRQYGGKFFNHNVHSVRVLKDISKRKGRGLSLQTLDGILCHNGELLAKQLEPSDLSSFAEFEKKYKESYENKDIIKTYFANTLEGCLVRICDILAYIGKDRQDLVNVDISDKYRQFKDYGIGIRNDEMLRNVITNLIKNSLDKPYIKLDNDVANALDMAKKENYEIIYNSKEVAGKYKHTECLFKRVFETAYNDLKKETDISFIRRNYLNAKYLEIYNQDIMAGKYSAADIAVDYIASMTDDYFIDLTKELGFPEAKKIKYTGYFLKK